MCADLFRYILVGEELVVGEVVLGELRRVLRDRIKLPKETIAEIAGLLRDHPVVPKPRDHLHLGLPNRADEWVVASAVAGSADILVTGDAAAVEFGQTAISRSDSARHVGNTPRATAAALR
jgi:hypothetical protein